MVRSGTDKRRLGLAALTENAADEENSMKKSTIITLAAVLFVCIALNTGAVKGLMSWLSTPSTTRAEIAGKDGPITVTSQGTVLNRYAVLTEDAPAGAPSIKIANAGGTNGLDPASLTPGDVLLIIQMSGATIDTSDTPNFGMVTALNNAGRYEFVTVNSVTGDTVKINPPCGGLRYSYTASEKVQVIRVPQYTSLTINPGASVVAPAWNGASGGIIAVHVQNNAVIDGAIDASERGYRGAELVMAGGGGFRTDYRTTQQDFGALKGEGIAGYGMELEKFGGQYGRGAAANGGGGGTAHNSGGGGGANGTNGNTWTGQGVMDGGATGAAAWQLDPGYIANGNALTTSSGGGRGGYSYSITDQNALTTAPGNPAWDADNRREVGGLGGRPVQQDIAGRIFMGGGGGAGAQNNNSGGKGGQGGGLIFLIAKNVSGSGQIRSNGEGGGDTRLENRDGAGGGGAGGTIIIAAETLGGISAQARGGRGGNQMQPTSPALPTEAEGPGGGGGGGYIGYAGGTITTDITGGVNGTTLASALTEFPPNGATRGSTGKSEPGLPINLIPFCQTTTDLSITKTNNQNAVVPGAPVTYTIVATNNGPNDVFGVTITDTIPPVFSNVTWTCTASPASACLTPAGSGNINAQVNLINGGTATFQVTGTPDPSATGRVANTAVVTIPEGAVDPTPGNNSATDDDPFTPRADLSITKTNGGTSVVAGTQTSYTIVVANNGPSAVVGATVADVVPAILTSPVWTCAASPGGACGAAGGNGNINTTVNLLPGATATFTLTGVIETAATGSIVNTATVAVPQGVTETTPGNNSATDTDTITQAADLSIAKTNNSTSVVAGTQTTYTITVTNNGPSAVTGAQIVDSLPAYLTNASWTCTASAGSSCGSPGGNGGIAATVSLINGGTATFTLTATVSSTASVQDVVNTATVQPPANVSDPTPGNNSATDSDALVNNADLSITKTNGSSTVIAGAQTVYTITVTNNGPSAVTNAQVSDVLPSQLSNASWTCVASSGSSCGAAAGTGNISSTVSLLPGGTAAYTLTATVSAGATGTVTNTATVTPPNGTTDNTPGNNTGTDTDTITSSADLAITKVAGSTSGVPGQQISYTIEVTNNGPSHVTGATVTDPLPSSLTDGNWSCTATAGSSCGAAAGAGSINTTVNLLTGGKATFTLTARILDSATGTIVNQASVNPPQGTTDNTPGNNSSTTTTPIEPAADLGITKTASAASIRAGDELVYTLVVTNNGPSMAANVQVVDTVVDTVQIVSVQTNKGTCAAAGQTITCAIGSLGAAAPNNTATVTIRVRVPFTYPVGPLPNSAVVSSETSDKVPGNNSSSTTTTITAPPGARFSPVNVLVRNIATDACIGSGNLISVEVKLTNSGDGVQNDNPGPEMVASLPVQLTGVAGSCSTTGGSCTVGATQIEWNGTIQPGQSVTITYQVRVRQGVEPGTRFCTDIKVNYDTNSDGINESMTVVNNCLTANCVPPPCSGPDCPDIGPGNPFPFDQNAVSGDDKPGSMLIFPFYISDPTGSNIQNTRINITNIEASRPAYLHLFFIDGTSCNVADNFICLTPNQTTSFLLSDFDPGVSGYIIALAVDDTGRPTKFNFLIGDEYIKMSSGHSANLGAEAVAAVNLPEFDPSNGKAVINLDGVMYTRLGRVVAADSIPSVADGNSTLLILDRIGGDLSISGSLIGPVFGLLYDDIERPFSFSFNQSSCQFRSVLSSSFPRSLPRFPEVVPAGRTGWMKLWMQNDGALVGATINSNSLALGYRGGHNLHKLTLANTSLTIPVFAPSCQ